MLSKEKKIKLSEYGIDISKFKPQLKGSKVKVHDILTVNFEQLLMGIKVEYEHTTDPYISMEIALSHLKELNDYYTRLAKMEKGK
jgi:hypothetical protein